MGTRGVAGLRLRAASGVAVASGAAAVGLGGVLPGPADVLGILGVLQSAVLAVVLLARRGSADAPRRLAWWGMAVGVGLGAAGVAAGGVTPSGAAYPPEGNVVFPAACAVVIGAFFVLVRTPGERQARIRAALDAAIAACAFGVMAYDVGVTESAGVMGAVHPLAALLLATAVVMAIGRCPLDGEPPFASVFAAGVGFIVMSLGDLLAVAAWSSGEWTPHHPSVLVDIAGILVVAWAAIAPSRKGDVGRLRVRERIAVLTPVVPMLGAAGLIIASLLRAERPSDWTVVMMGVLGVLLLASWISARLDQLLLSRTLEYRVVERTLALRTHAKWFRSLVQNSSDIITIVDAAGIIRYQTPSVERVLGYDPTSMVGRPFTSLLAPGDARRLEQLMVDAALHPRFTHTLELAMRHAEGHWRETETVLTSLVNDHDIRGIVLNTRDVSERKELERQLLRQAFSDPLTGLANRALFSNRVEHALAERSRQPGDVAVLFLDLDGFKSVNDAQGHAIGDHLLTVVADRLRGCVRPGDTVARLGGDEFAILVVGAQAEDVAVDIAQRIQTVLAQPFVLDGREANLGASIGIAVTESGSETADQLLRNADLAMYRAKASGEGGYVRFRTEMHHALVVRMQTEADLRHALARGELVLHFQPTVNLRTGMIVGVEALIRWYHPLRGLVRPMDFIETAEETGLVESIGSWAIRECCRHGARWQRYAEPGRVFHVAVNVSSRQLHPRLPEVVRAALSETGMPPGALVIEVTESILIKHTVEAIDVLRRLKTLGVRIAIDDFGTGYSSLSYLAKFPVDILKIDKSFVEQLGRGRAEVGGTELTRTIVQLGQVLRLGVVAEGIETREQYAALLAMACDYGQGFLFSRPLPASGIETLFANTVAAVPRPTQAPDDVARLAEAQTTGIPGLGAQPRDAAGLSA
ncbi:MAG: EAL domain-containing protein [Acidothermus sp.]|nr:EAL domain-containing protein [Acidothermus sp.]